MNCSEVHDSSNCQNPNKKREVIAKDIGRDSLSSDDIKLTILKFIKNLGYYVFNF